MNGLKNKSFIFAEIHFSVVHSIKIKDYLEIFV